MRESVKKSATVYIGNESKLNDLGVTQPDYKRVQKSVIYGQ